MQLKHYNVYFFFFVLLGVTLLAYFVLQPFLVPFLIAAIFAHLFSFLYRGMLRILKSKGLSSGLACLVVALIIIIPLVLVISLLVNEVDSIVVYFSQNPEIVRRKIQSLAEGFSTLPILKELGIGDLITKDATVTGIKNFSESALGILRGTYTGISHFAFVTFIMFFSLFYLFIDGARLVKKIMSLSPLRDKYEIVLVEKFNSIVRATIKGTTLIAILQGLMGGLLFWATGVPSPVVLGIVMTVSSVIPSIGSGLVWLPVGIIMLIAGEIVPGIVILLVGGLVISLADNFIRPKLVGRDTQLHPLLILFSTLGGIALFGISGFIVGPIVVSLFVALWDIYSLEFKNQLEEYNK